MPIVKLTFRFALVLSLGISLGVAAVAPAAAGPTCSIPQSPRNLDRRSQPSPYFLTSDNSIVSEATPESLVYRARLGGPPQQLLRCGQHYHFPIENPQGCGGKRGATMATAGSERAAKPGDWIEVHTVYAAKVKPGNCDPETLCCCEQGPVLVRAFAAKVTGEGPVGPIVPPGGRPLAEWSGSSSGAEYPPVCPSAVAAGPATDPAGGAATPGEPIPECKSAAVWSLRLGCGFLVSEAQLRAFKHADPARPVQPADRLSRDLTLVHGNSKR